MTLRKHSLYFTIAAMSGKFFAPQPYLGFIYSGSPSMPSGGIQTLLEEADSDAILIHDPCSSADTSTMPQSSPNSVTNVIARCGVSGTAPGPGPHFFTNALIKDLTNAAGLGVDFSVSQMFSRLVEQLRYGPNHEVLTSTSVHCNLIFESNRCHIMLQPLRDDNFEYSNPLIPYSYANYEPSA